MKAYGKKTWLIADNYLNSVSLNDWNSHEAVCVLNTSEIDAEIRFTLYFEDRDPNRSFFAVCPAQRTHHIRLDKIIGENNELIPRDVPYAMLIESNVPVVVQYSRLDTSRRELALMTTVAYPVEE
ncbi:MAG: hypothetical protein IJC50_00215 [Clostridia bacterium]|nr:hypothetical protein [Clostridia bacterium]